MIELKNINLDNISIEEQYEKETEENIEFSNAILKYLVCKNEITKEHVIEEFWDVVQVKIGVLQKYNITADEIMKGYKNHLEKIKNRPRVKQK